MFAPREVWLKAQWLLLLLVLLGTSLACASRESVGQRSLTVLGEGVVNNPQNKSLRFDILKYGLDRFCQEMQSRGVPLRMSSTDPIAGRFFAEGCQSQIIDEEARKSFILQYWGQGYAWTNVTGRIGFKTRGLVEFAPDFRLHGEAMYVYFRPRNISATSFELVSLGSAVAKLGAGLAQVDVHEAGRQVVEGQLRQGFTVIRKSERGETDFGLGLVPLGEAPFRPFSVQATEKAELANDRSELQPGEQDFVAGFSVPESEQALFFTFVLDGTSAVDAFLVPKGQGQLMIQQYLQSPLPAALTSPPLMDEVLTVGQPMRRFVRVPPGEYYLVFDHSPSLGRAVEGPGAARIDYLVQLGEAP